MQKVLPKDVVLIPDDATRVFQGIIFDVYQWQQQLFDGNMATFERLRRPDTMVVLAVKDGKLVMTHDVQPARAPRFTFPGGRADNTDESWLAAAQRELLEETGLRFRQWKLAHVAAPQSKIEWFVAFYVAWDFDSQQAATFDKGGEQITTELVDFDRARTMALDGGELDYARPLFLQAKTLDELLALPEFKGTAVDR